jgi:2-oxopent-4-enoate hydratase
LRQPSPQTFIDELAEQLLLAESDRLPIPPLTSRYPEMKVEDAYRIQMRIVEAKKARGMTVVGKKAGVTSEAIQQMFGVNEPDYGHLFDYMVVPSGGTIRCADLIQPKAEPEVGFFLREDLRGPGVQVADVLDATAQIAPVLEIIDSRIEHWKIKLPDTIADNASCGMVVLGTPVRLKSDIDLKNLEAHLEKNGKFVASGFGKAVLGDPSNAIAWLANKLATLGASLKAGEWILPGSICAAVDAEPGDRIEAKFTGLGTVSVSFV